MLHLRKISSSVVVTIALSLVAACTQGADPEAARAIEIAGPLGAATSVTVLATERSATDGYAEVQVGGRAFTLVQWIDATSGARHDVVASLDGELRYEYVADATGGHVVVTDRAGTRVVAAGGALGELDADAAALLMSFRPLAPAADVAYSYHTLCVYYDTSNPADWHLAVAGCTCDHWYSVICTLD